MKTSILHIRPLYGFLLSILFLCACNTEEWHNVNAGHDNTCRLIWDANIVGFGGDTRAALREKRDGDCVYLRFKSGGDYVDGKAVYKEASEEWILTYNGSLTTGETSSCTAYYIEDMADEHPETISLGHQTLVCCDMDAEYTKLPGNNVKLSAYLTPVSGRIRFKGEAGQKFLFSGITYNTMFDVKTTHLTSDNTPLELTVDENGFTPYVHALPLADRTISVYYDYQTYKTPCESPILDAGRSGYMLLPTEGDHNGWTLIKVEAPSLSSVSVGVVSDVMVEVNASVTSLGNGTLLDAGFVYSETPEPTLESNKHSCGTVTSLHASVTGLKPVTEYHIRAYATNERGTTYSETIKIRTKAEPIVPKVSTGTVSNVQDCQAEVGGSIIDLGEVDQIIQYGHVWSTLPNPTIKDSRTEFGATSELGDYSSVLTKLSPNTKYYVRAYAVNEVGTSYGEEMSFQTEYGAIELTVSASAIYYNNATIKVSITSLGGHSITERGVCWGLTAEPTIEGNKMASDQPNDNFEAKITGLQENTVYYARVYLKIENNKIAYSKDVKFTTPPKDEQFRKEDFDDDCNWSGNASIFRMDLEREDYGEDENWGGNSSSSGNDINKGDYNEDENWGSKSSSSGNDINKGDYNGDENWSNIPSSSGNAVNKADYEPDNDWGNESSSSGNDIQREGYEDDADWSTEE